MAQIPTASQNASLILGTLHHVEIYVSNLEATKNFWGWLMEALNYNVFQEWDGGISYLQGETYIVFVQVEDRFQTPPYHRCRVGLNHLAFHAPTREIVDNITQTLRTVSHPREPSKIHQHRSSRAPRALPMGGPIRT